MPAVVLLWLYRFDVERRWCCSGSIYLTWRGGGVALALSIWRGEKVVLHWLYLFGMERRWCCSGSMYLAWRGGGVALALSI